MKFKYSMEKTHTQIQIITWNGITNMPMTTSANAKFAMNKLVTVCICRVVATIHITNELPMTAIILMLP